MLFWRKNTFCSLDFEGNKLAYFYVAMSIDSNFVKKTVFFEFQFLVYELAKI